MTPDQEPKIGQVATAVEPPIGQSASDASAPATPQKNPHSGIIDALMDVADALHKGGADAIPDRESINKLAAWLPTAGGVVGGLLGTAGGPAGTVGGAALGGGSGEALRQLSNRATGAPAPATMGEAAGDIGTQAAVQGGAEAAGAGLGAFAKFAAPRLMQSAVKPSVEALMDRTGNMPTVVKTMLDNGVNVTQNGVKKLYDLLGANTAKIKTLTDASTATVDPMDAVKPVYDLLTERANQVNAAQDLNAINAAADQFLTEQAGPMSVAKAQALKQGTYKVLGDKAYTGELKSADTEGQKAIAHGLKTEIERFVPDAQSLNAESGKLLDAIDEVAKRANLSGNKDLGGIYWIAQHPGAFLAAQFDRSPAIKSLVANGLYKQAGVIAKTSPQLIRLAVQSLAMTREQDQK